MNKLRYEFDSGRLTVSYTAIETAIHVNGQYLGVIFTEPLSGEWCFEHHTPLTFPHFQIPPNPDPIILKKRIHKEIKSWVKNSDGIWEKPETETTQ